MKIKNKNVIIKSGKKTYELHNMVLDEYLKRFALYQSSTEYLGNTLYLSDCVIKFDSPIEFDEKSEITNDEFDVCFEGKFFLRNL